MRLRQGSTGVTAERGRWSPARAWGLGAALALLTTAAVGCSPPSSVSVETLDHSFVFDGTPTLVVRNDNGPIHVSAGRGRTIRVRTELKNPSKVDYDVRRDGNTVIVTATVSKRGWRSSFGTSASADIMVTVPVEANVELRTSNSSITVIGLRGSGTFRTSNGPLRIQDVGGRYIGITSNGAITVQGIDGTGTFRTSNSWVELREARGSFVTKTSNGAIFFAGKLSPEGHNRFETSNGSVIVLLEENPSLSIDASTSNGTVTSRFPILASLTSDSHLVGTIGEGEADLVIRTTNGSVTIEGR